MFTTVNKITKTTINTTFCIIVPVGIRPEGVRTEKYASGHIPVERNERCDRGFFPKGPVKIYGNTGPGSQKFWTPKFAVAPYKHATEI